MDYQSYLDAIKSTKSQQWLTSYYVVLLQGAIVGLYLKAGDISPNNYGILRSLFIGCSFGISFLGTVIMARYMYDMYKYRCTRNEIGTDLHLEGYPVEEESLLKKIWGHIIEIFFIFGYIGIAVFVWRFLAILDP